MIILALESRNPLVDSINLIDQRNSKNATGSFTERHNGLFKDHCANFVLIKISTKSHF